ncbi:MAG: hypothetical protein SWL02_14830 [Pseudomonadota bacterium]|nr:hypothetical protein [Pseudomonadota bacterium]
MNEEELRGYEWAKETMKDAIDEAIEDIEDMTINADVYCFEKGALKFLEEYKAENK